MTIRQNAHHADTNGRLLNLNIKMTNQERVLREKRPNSSIVSAALLLGVSVEILELYLPAILAAHETNKKNENKIV